MIQGLLEKITCKFSSGEKKFRADYEADLAKTAAELEKLLQYNAAASPIDTLIEVYNVLNVWCDRRPLVISPKAPSQIAMHVELLNGSFAKIRNPYGTNRAPKNQPSTPHNVFLGNIYGLFTKTAHSWKFLDPAEKMHHPHLPPETTILQVIEKQALGEYQRLAHYHLASLRVILGSWK